MVYNEVGVMSNIKEFARDQRGYCLMGDSRDIGVSTRHYVDVTLWIHRNNIKTARRTHTGMGTDVWRIEDEHERVLFALKWS